MFNVSEFPSRTISWWYSQKKFIDFHPSYQRKGKVWNSEDKSFLIDSILNDYDIPKIYMANFTFPGTLSENDAYKYAVVDGKQRLEAMFDFYEDKFPLSGKFVYEEDPNIEISGLKFSEIRFRYPDISLKFENFNIQVMSIVTDEPGKINALFVRLNTSKPLTGAELRAAQPGAVPGLIHEISRHRFFLHHIRFPNKRGEDLNAAAKLLLIEFMGGFSDTKKNNLDNLISLSDSREDAIQHAKRRVIKVLDQMCKVFVESDPLLKSQGPITVYYWLVKHMGEKYTQIMRDFLLDFENKRASLRIKDIKDAEIEIERQIIIYNSLSRSVNDRKSLEIRYGILENSFREYIEDYNRKMHVRFVLS